MLKNFSNIKRSSEKSSDDFFVMFTVVMIRLLELNTIYLK
ncbi:hypothetical protein MCC93_05310 [Morococcus cerebrosus]|uniref:Uncharacterized protein n=1 Tax=Morococcus cerebrosus TaxID=1056807 RepID=A0A0C1HC76_9NEIS|nr:hypothetical protein MCC93_05310 [Morococcus cerebrosus]KJJ20015.1 hypothetical protein HMPREF3156_00573 [Neisseria sp. HMSC06F02]